jgi:hypothetical protein
MLINSDRAWQQLIRNKCLGSKSLTQVTKKIGGLPILVWLDECKDDFFEYGRFYLTKWKSGKILEGYLAGWYRLKSTISEPLQHCEEECYGS